MQLERVIPFTNTFTKSPVEFYPRVLATVVLCLFWLCNGKGQLLCSAVSMERWIKRMLKKFAIFVSSDVDFFYTKKSPLHAGPGIIIVMC